MRTRLTGLALALLLAGTASSAGAEATPPIPITRPTAALEADLRALSRIGSGSHGSVGIAAWRLDGKGPQILVNADDLFPMASTFKVAVAAALLSKVEAGSVRLDQMIDIKLDRMVESEVLQDRFIHPGLSVSVANLLELMLTESDNTATDYITALAGGPAGVTGWIRSQGLEGIRVDSDTSQLIRRHEDAPATGTFKEAMEAALKANPDLARRDGMPYAPFDTDTRDTAQPVAMARLLERIFRGQALKPDSTATLVGIMERCRSGAKRLRGLMPADTVVAHKTGTLGGTNNDVGVITLPRGAGKVVIAVFIKASDASYAQRERAIAEIGRAVRDYFLYASVR